MLLGISVALNILTKSAQGSMMMPQQHIGFWNYDHLALEILSGMEEHNIPQKLDDQGGFDLQMVIRFQSWADNITTTVDGTVKVIDRCDVLIFIRR